MQQLQELRLIMSQLSGRRVESLLEIDPHPVYHQPLADWSRPGHHLVVRERGSSACPGCREREAGVEVERFDQLPIRSGSVDRTLLLGIRALLRTNVRALFRECFRVTRPGGDLLIATIPDDPLAPLAEQLDGVFLPILKRLIASPAPLRGCLTTMEELREAATEAGWDCESERSWLTRRRYDSPAQLVEFIRYFSDAHFVPQLQSVPASWESELIAGVENLWAETRDAFATFNTILTFRRPGPLPAVTVGSPEMGPLRRGRVGRRGAPAIGPRRARHVSWILDRLAISGAPREREHVAELEAGKVTHVLDLRPTPHFPASLSWPRRTEVINLPVTDDLVPFSVALLGRALRIVRATLRNPNHRVVIACDAGEHRSPLIAYLYLRSIGLPARASLALIQERRPIADFPIVYLRSAEDALRRLTSRSRGPAASPPAAKARSSVTSAQSETDGPQVRSRRRASRVPDQARDGRSPLPRPTTPGTRRAD